MPTFVVAVTTSAVTVLALTVPVVLITPLPVSMLVDFTAPFTSNFTAGSSVPIPTLPSARITSLLLLTLLDAIMDEEISLVPTAKAMRLPA
jgi:hypothetical protein